jgi:hypothetical protein
MSQLNSESFMLKNITKTNNKYLGIRLHSNLQRPKHAANRCCPCRCRPFCCKYTHTRLYHGALEYTSNYGLDEPSFIP